MIKMIIYLKSYKMLNLQNDVVALKYKSPRDAMLLSKKLEQVSKLLNLSSFASYSGMSSKKVILLSGSQ